MGTGAPGAPEQRLAQLGRGEGSAGCPGNGLLLRQRAGLTHTSGVPEARAGWEPCSAWDPRPIHPRQAELGTTRPCRSVLAPAAGSSLHTCPGTGREDSGCPPSPTPAGNVGGGRLPWLGPRILFSLFVSPARPELCLPVCPRDRLGLHSSPNRRLPYFCASPHRRLAAPPSGLAGLCLLSGPRLPRSRTLSPACTSFPCGSLSPQLSLSPILSESGSSPPPPSVGLPRTHTHAHTPL